MTRERKIGLGTWSYMLEGSPGFDVVARRVADLGYDGIELDGSEAWFHPSRYPAAGDRRELRERIRRLGLEPCAYNPAFYHHDLASKDAGDRARYLQDVEQALRFAADCEIELVRLDTAQAPPGPPDRVRRTVEAWSAAAERAEQLGVRLAWEFEPGFMCNSPSEVVAVVEGIPSPAFGVLFDTCHAHMVAEVGSRQETRETLDGGSAALAQRLEGRIHLVHVIDSDGTLHDDFTSTHVPIGDGRVDFAAVLGACVDAGYAGPWFTIDLCFWPYPERHESTCLTALRTLVDAAEHGREVSSGRETP